MFTWPICNIKLFLDHSSALVHIIIDLSPEMRLTNFSDHFHHFKKIKITSDAIRFEKNCFLSIFTENCFASSLLIAVQHSQPSNTHPSLMMNNCLLYQIAVFCIEKLSSVLNRCHFCHIAVFCITQLSYVSVNCTVFCTEPICLHELASLCMWI